MDSAVEFQGLVLVRGFQGFATYDRSLSFKGWMFTIIKNTYIDRFRRQRRLPQGEPLWAVRGSHRAGPGGDSPAAEEMR